MRSSPSLANHTDMVAKDSWDVLTAATPGQTRLPAEAEIVIDRAGRLSRAELERLDQADRVDDGFRLVAWDLLRDRLTGEDNRAMRLSARDRAWAAVNESLRSSGAA